MGVPVGTTTARELIRAHVSTGIALEVLARELDLSEHEAELAWRAGRELVERESVTRH